MPKLTETTGKLHICQSCKAEFVIPESETAVCCPICRMNRIIQIE
jgi:DNA-directed RNA polymerase subunit RPC12/RpoP